jgi:hypothetical protein
MKMYAHDPEGYGALYGRDAASGGDPGEEADAP